MISNQEIAVEVSTLMLEIGAKLDESVARVQASCPQPEFERYRRAVGRVMGAMLLDIMNPLYTEHPALKPAGLNPR